MAKFLDRAGIRYGRLIAIEKCGRDNSGAILWSCECDCGNIKNVRGTHLGKGVMSCGCLHIDTHTTHGMTKTVEYETWCSIKKRCYHKKSVNYKLYGARGISVCDEWRYDFLAFYNHIGSRPSNIHSIDRIENNGNYEPGNVRWATEEEQQNNKRNNVLITFNGTTMTLQQWSNKVSIDRKTISNRINKFNWSVENALTIRPIPGGNYK